MYIIYIFQSIASRFININLKKDRFSCNLRHFPKN